MTSTEGARRLQNVVQSEVNSGKRVAYQTNDSVTLESGKRVNHVLHLIVSIIFLVWSVVWFIFEMTGGVKRETVTVDEDGNVNRREVEGTGNPMWAKIVSGIMAAFFVIAIIAVFGGM